MQKLIADSYVVRLDYNCGDDGFVVASLRGLLDEKNQRDILYLGSSIHDVL